MGSCSSASQFKSCDKCMKSFSETAEEELMLRIAIIIGSTRPGRNGEAVGKWVYEIAQKRSGAEFELVDIKDFNLPLLDEPMPPIMGQYSKPHTKAWAAKIGSFDGFVFITPEYNHGTSGALKNAIDFLFREWNDKAAGFVSYGGAGGARAVEQLRLAIHEEGIRPVKVSIALRLSVVVPRKVVVDGRKIFITVSLPNCEAIDFLRHVRQRHSHAGLVSAHRGQVQIFL